MFLVARLSSCFFPQIVGGPAQRRLSLRHGRNGTIRAGVIKVRTAGFVEYAAEVSADRLLRDDCKAFSRSCCRGTNASVALVLWRGALARVGIIIAAEVAPAATIGAFSTAGPRQLLVAASAAETRAAEVRKTLREARATRLEAPRELTAPLCRLSIFSPLDGLIDRDLLR